jgi:hypothetical protein
MAKNRQFNTILKKKYLANFTIEKVKVRISFWSQKAWTED